MDIDISIIVPVYNVREYISRCIMSLINQTLKSIQIILIDDGSTDDSGLICDQMKSKDDRIYVFHKENERQGVARNYGLDRAVGKYVMFVDADDYIPLDTCEILINEAKNGTIDIIEGNRLYIKQDIAKELNHSSKQHIIFSGQEYMLNELTHSTMYFVPVAKILKREFLITNSIYFKSGILLEDEEWGPRVYAKADKVKYVNKTVYYHMCRKGSTMDTMTYENHKSLLKIYPELKSFLDKEIQMKQLKRALFSRMHNLYILAVTSSKLYKESSVIFLLSISGSFREVIKVVYRVLIPGMRYKIR